MTWDNKLLVKRMKNAVYGDVQHELVKAIKELEIDDLDPIDLEDQDAVLGKFWDYKIETWDIDDDFS